MAAPLVALAKFAGKKVFSKIQEKYPGGVIGLIATLVFASMLYGYVVINTVSGIMSSLSTGSIVSEDQCAFVNDFAYVDADGMGAEVEESSGDEDSSADPADTDTLIMPLADIHVNSHYGARKSPLTQGGNKGSSDHKGTDYRGTTGTPIYAVADGVVYKAGNIGGLGQRIAIKHKIKGKILYVVYGHTTNATKYFKEGDSVKAGDVVAEVGNTGNSSAPHLHMEVWSIPALYGAVGSVDPHKWLLDQGALKTVEVEPTSGNLIIRDGDVDLPEELLEDADIKQLMIDCNIVQEDSGSDEGNGVGAGAWGGHENGRIPDAAMCEFKTARGHKARCDAAENFDVLNEEYKKKFGAYMSITDSYRDYDAQVRVRAAKPTLAAVPGTSNHGWGLALDIGSGMSNPLSATYGWMRANGPSHGWIHPTWARTIAEGGSKPEAWHWEFVGRSDSQGKGTVAEAQAYAKQKMASEYKWDDKQYKCLVEVWNRESRWDYKAANPGSTARGIPQAMMSAHFRNWESNPDAKKFLESPTVQIDWGLNYIDGRYTTPCGAWAFWQLNNYY